MGEENRLKDKGANVKLLRPKNPLRYRTMTPVKGSVQGSVSRQVAAKLAIKNASKKLRKEREEALR